jgi:hypothetical protein
MANAIFLLTVTCLLASCQFLVQSRWTSDPEQACCGHGLDALDTCGEQVTQILWTGMG